MLKIVTQKLRSQSLNEIQPYYPEEVDDDKDSGTESDDERVATDHEAPGEEEEEDVTEDEEAGPPKPETPSYPPLPALVPFKRPLKVVSPTYDHDDDSDRLSLGYETTVESHSSEDELTFINTQKRTWSQRRSSCCSLDDSAGSSDDEVRDLLAGDDRHLHEQPVLFSSSPPRGVQQHLNHRTVFCMRKRHRRQGCADVSEAIQRPCLDFDKMQVSASVICFY